MKSLVASALEELDETKKQVVTLYYIEELTMKEVGALLGLGESRVSQIHSVAMVRLRARLEELLLARLRNISSIAPSLAASRIRPRRRTRLKMFEGRKRLELR